VLIILFFEKCTPLLNLSELTNAISGKYRDSKMNRGAAHGLPDPDHHDGTPSLQENTERVPSGCRPSAGTRLAARSCRGWTGAEPIAPAMEKMAIWGQ
jgi:hypothetical protein